MSDQESRLEASDAELLRRAQSGDSGAFAGLWRRHHRSAARVARQFTSTIDADDLVSEAYARIYQRVLAGGGPTGAFRPYLYATIRNLASSWGAASREVTVEEFEEFADERIPDDPTSAALDRALTVRAFRSLPERWQTVLWYTEVEGMDPHEVAPILGLTANGVAALSYRAREGLRTAWLQAHVSVLPPDGDCEWTLARLGGHSRKSLSARDEARFTKHLAECTRCSIVADEVDEVGSHLALVMLPLILGGVAGGALLSQLAPGAATAAGAGTTAATVAPAAAAGGAAVGAAAGGTATVGAAGAASGALVGGLALAAVIGGSVVLGGVAVGDEARTTPETAVVAEADDDGSPDAVARTGGPVTASDPADVLETLLPGPVTGGATGELGEVVDDVVDAVTPTEAPAGQEAPPQAPVSATVDLDFTGHGTPGATVAAQVAGTVWATTKVGKDGRWSIRLDAVPQGAGSVTLTQKTTGLVGGLLGGVLTPLTLDTGPLGVVVTLLG